MLGDQCHDLFGGVAARVARPGDAAVGDEDRQVGLGAGVAMHEADEFGVGVGGEPALIGFGIGDGGGQADAAHFGGEVLEAGEGQRKQVAALFPREGVDFVDDDGLEAREDLVADGVAQQQAEAFGGGQEDVRRARALAGLAVGGGIATARLDADVEVHFLDRGEQVALDVDR